MDLVHPVDEVNGQVDTILLGMQSFRQAGGETHLKKAPFASARTVVEPVGWEIHILRGLSSRFAEIVRQRVR